MPQVASMTNTVFSDRDREEDAKLLCEFWTSACITETELLQNSSNPKEGSVILGNLESLLDLFLNVMKRGQENAIEEMPEDGDKEWDMSMAACCTIEHFARLAGNNII